jgi:lipoate synthase
MRPTEIVRELQKMDSNLFSRLTSQTVGGWIDREGTAPRWSTCTLERVKQANKPGGVTTRVGVLVGYPEVTEQILRSLEQLWETSVPLTLITIRGIMIAQLQHSTPQIFKVPSPDGTLF